jgi:hypothetical protein
MAQLSIWLLGFAVVLGAIVIQLIMPFAADLIATLAVYAAGVFVGRASAQKK